MKANYINIDGVTGIHVEFKNGFIMNIPVDFDNDENLTEILLDLFWAEEFMTDEWDMGKSLAYNLLNSTYRPVEYRDGSIICIDLEDETPYAVYVDITGYPRLAPFQLQKFFLSRCYYVAKECWAIPLYKITMPKLPKEVPDRPWSFSNPETSGVITGDYFTEMRDDIFDDYLLDCYSNNDII